MKISISNDYSKCPKGRKDARHFLNILLLPKFKQVVENQSKLQIDFDDTIGYGFSFLYEIFYSLQLLYKDICVENYMEFISYEEPYLVDDILKIIKDARTDYSVFDELKEKYQINMSEVVSEFQNKFLSELEKKINQDDYIKFTNLYEVGFFETLYVNSLLQ